ncbi:MAG: hypothetical protein ABF617_03900 [Gluconobacter japonicus]|uniref:hypothetical protein n=1 Tax=Gluconobacter japonicus TaxID=376620 RepID=UPI0039E7E44C
MRPIALFSFSTLAFLAACAAPDPGKDPTGRWVGALVTDQGTCPTERTSTFEIRGKTIVFTPGDGSQVLTGKYQPGTHHYHAELASKDTSGHPSPLVFNGYPVGQAIGGTFGSAACRAHITMTRK